MKRILFSLFFVVAMAVWCTPSFATQETIGTTGSPWTSDSTGSADGYFINNGGAAYTLDVTSGFPDVFTGNSSGPYTSPAVSTNNASLSSIVFSSNGTSNVYGAIGTGAVFADITMTGTTAVNFYGTVNTTAMDVATGSANFLSVTNNNAAAITFTGDGTVSLAANTQVTGAITNEGTQQGTLVLNNASILNGAVGGTTGLRAINVGASPGAGISATITGAVKTYLINLWTNTLNIGGALTIAPNGVINTTVTNSGYGTVITAGAVTIGTGTVIDETIVGSASIIAATGATGIVKNYTAPITVVTTIGTGGTLTTTSNETLGSLSGAAGSTISIGSGDTLTTGTLNTNDSDAGVISGTGGALTKVGTGTLTLSGANTYTGTTTANGGVLQIGNGVTGSLNGTTGTALTSSGGTANFDEASGSTQGMGALTFSSGEGTVQSTYTGGNTLTFSSLAARTAGATGNFIVSGGANGTTNKIVLTGQGTGFINQGTFFGGNNYAYYDSTGYVRGINYGVDSGTATSAGGVSLTSGANPNQQFTGAITAQATGQTFTTLNDSGNNNFTLAAGATVTVNGILKSGNVAGGATIGGGTGIEAANNAELAIRTDGANDALTISTPILANGANALTKSGAGTLTLNGANTYTGLTSINDGTLSINTVAAGATAQSLGENANLNISGGGTLQYTGGANTLGKSITIGAGNGTISNTGGGALTLTGGIAKNGTVLTLTGTNTINVNGAISGASANSDLVVDNVTVNLNVANTYVGPTYIRSSGTAGLGILNANVVGALPTGTPSDVIMDDLGHGGSQLVLGASQSIASLTGAASSFVKLNAWTLTIGTGSGSTFAGVISGTGSLIKDGSNTLTLTGANTYTGTTTLTSGEVNLGVAEIAGTSGPLGQSAANNPGSIVLNGGYLQYSDANQNDYSGRFSTASAQQYNVDTNSQNVTWATALTSSGGGSLTKTGLGTLTLTGANTYTGATTVNAGTLQAGVATQAFGVGSAVTLNSTATLDLGGYSQTIGSLTENSGSILKLTVSSPSSFGNITTTGAVTLNTNPVNVVVAGYIPNNASLRVINAGTPMTAGSPLLITTTENGEFVYTPRVNFIGSIVNGDLILTADHSTTGFVSLADNPNARAAGRALDNVTNPSSDMTNVLNTLEFLNDAKTTSALNTMGPIADRGVLDSSTAALNNFIGASIERAQNVLTLTSSGNSESTGVSSGDESKLNGLWAKQYGSYLDQGTRDGIQGYNAWNAGTAVGVDRLVNDNFTLGVSVGYAYSKVDSDVNGASTDIQSAQGTLYAGYQGTNLPYYIDLAGSFAENWYNGQRNITVDTMNRIADASYNGQQSGVYFEGGYKFSLGNNLEITPLTSLQWTHLSLGSYTESNAGALDLNVNRQSYDILESGLGASIAYPVKYNWGNFTPEVHAKWLYDFINDNMVVTSAFTGGGGSFTSAGASPARNGANIGGKLSFDFKNNISVIAGVDTEMKDNFFGVSGTVAVRYKF